MEEPTEKQSFPTKKMQGVIWGKDTKHFSGKIDMLKRIADIVELHSTSTDSVFSHSNVIWHGHQSADGWKKILMQSKFLIGLGDPLLGPSAIDAIAAGCMYLNPSYRHPMREIFNSQHPYAADKIGEPYVCTFDSNDINSVLKCVKLALQTSLTPMIPKDFTKNEYTKRV